VVLGASRGSAFDDNHLSFGTGGSAGSERMRIDSSGNVGIGTTSPTYPLTVYGSNPDSEIVASFGSANDSGEYTAIGLSGFIAGNDATKAGLALKRVGTFGTGELHFLNNNTLNDSDMTLSDSKMMIDSSGNVGIGTSNITDGNLQIGEGNSTFNISVAGPRAKFGYDGDVVVQGGTSKGIKFCVNDSTLGSGEAARIDSSGNLLVGTTNTAPYATSNTTGLVYRADFGLLGVSRNNNYSGSFNRYGTDGDILNFRKDGTTVGSISNSGTLLDINGTGGLTFSEGGSEAMRIDSSGNLLVGKTSSGTTVNGVELSPVGVIYATRSGNVTGVFNRESSDGDIVQFRKDNSTVGSVSVSGSTTSYNTSSDERLKENIADANDAGDKIDAIQVRQYDWKADGSHQDYGMIAQELMTVAPEAVSGDPESDEMMGVDYSKLVPMLIKEVQSLRARVAQLETGV
jgi:hypothetical protein